MNVQCTLCACGGAVKADVTADVLAFVPTTMRMNANPDKKKRKIVDSEPTKEKPKELSASEGAYQDFMKQLARNDT
jgi:hypothetical protein